MLLADPGADVVKVERPSEGRRDEKLGAALRGREAAYFLSVNRGKRSLALDLQRPEGQEIVLRHGRAARRRLRERPEPARVARVRLRREGGEKADGDHGRAGPSAAQGRRCRRGRARRLRGGRIEVPLCDTAFSAELGYGEHQITALEREGVVACVQARVHARSES
jgi:hypothetical protein